jgi:hypothetical protein
VDEEPEDDDDVAVEDFVEGLAVAAWAMAPPPPMRRPETVRATAALRITCDISFTSFLPCRRPVKRPALGAP